MALVQPFAWGKFVETGQFGEAFKFSEILDMLKANIGPALIVLLVYALASFLASMVGSILCGIGLFFTMFYAQLVSAYLFGTLYRQARGAAREITDGISASNALKATKKSSSATISPTDRWWPRASRS